MNRKDYTWLAKSSKRVRTIAREAVCDQVSIDLKAAAISMSRAAGRLRTEAAIRRRWERMGKQDERSVEP